jgi:hypothetical protein
MHAHSTKKAFLACMYESGARPEVFLRLTNYDELLNDAMISYLISDTDRLFQPW